MKRKMFFSINVSKEEFKKIKRGKQTFIIRLNDEENQKISTKDKVIIRGKIDRFKKRVKNTHIYSNLDNLANSVGKKQLGYKKKDIPNYDDLVKDYSKEDIEKYGILGIELKPKKHIFRNILLGFLVIVLLFFGYRFIKDKIMDIEVRKFNNTLNKVAKERIDYVFIEINPSLVLTVKDNKVEDISCLNDDCMTIYNELDVKGKNINDGIDTIYNKSKEKGFDVSKGVKVKTSNNVNIEVKDYISIEHIDSVKEKELLEEVKNNEEIKHVSNDDYYTNLWEELKKDKDYDNVYSCKMNNNELECYIKDNFVILEKDLANITNRDELVSKFPKLYSKMESIDRVLKKFKVNVSDDRSYSLLELPAGILHIGASTLEINLGGTAKEVTYSGRMRCGFYKVYLTKINLLKSDNIPYVRDESFYDDEKDSWKTTIVDEFHITKERDFNYCNEVQCVKIHEIEKSYCIYDDSKPYGEWVEERVPDVYQECDLGYKNCRYVPPETYDTTLRR